MPADAAKHETFELNGLRVMEERTGQRESIDIARGDEEESNVNLIHHHHHHDDENDDDDRRPLVLAPGTSSEENARLNRRTIRKLDLILLPFLALLFLLNSMDKSNIGNAETAGFTHDAGLSRADINEAMAAFFFVFVLLQPFSAALGRRFGMRRWVPACMALWGMTTILHIWVHTKWQLILLRVAIAILESGTYPTTVAYLSLFYTRFEFGVRLGFFYSMTAVSGALGGILSWAVFSQIPSEGGGAGNVLPPPAEIEAARKANLRNWQVLFLIEGCMTVTIALIGFFYLPPSAETAWFFTAREKAWAAERIRLDMDDSIRPKQPRSKSLVDETDGAAPLLPPEAHLEEAASAQPRQPTTTEEEETSQEPHHSLLRQPANPPPRLQRLNSIASPAHVTAAAGLSSHDIASAVFNYKIWFLLIINILSAIPATAFGVLLPILVEELSPSLSLSPAQSNLLAAPPFAFGALVLFAFTAWSDYSRQRLLPILGGLALLLVGLTMSVAASMDKYWVRYFSLCVLLSGSFIASPLTVAWLANNTPEPGKRAIVLGINGWGNFAGVFILFLFTPGDRDEGYIRSYVATLACVLASFTGFITFYVLLIWENKWRGEVVGEWTEEEREREALVGDMPVPEQWSLYLARRVGLYSLAKKLGLEDIRKGDDKLTYRYGF